jgi:hypothetical protein
MASLKQVLAALAVALPLVSFAQTPAADPAKPADAAAPAAPAAAQPAPAAEPAKAPAPAPAAAPASKITPYGFVLLNAFWDSTTFGQGDYADFATQPGPTRTGQFVMRASQSRFGLRFDLGQDPVTGAMLKGLVEVDFAGAFVTNANTSWEAPLMRLRHAWGSATWKDLGNLTLLAGQESSVVQPLFAVSLASVQKPRFWRAGNLWRRSPQIRLSGELGGDIGLTWAAAVLQPTAADKGGAPDADPSEGAGTRARMPHVEGRLAAVYKPGGKKMLEIGASGHYGKEKHTYQLQYTPAAADPYVTTDLDSTVVAADLQLFIPYVELRGEFFIAKNAEDMSYGAPGTYRPDDPASATATGEIDVFDTKGGWAQINLVPMPLFNVFFGYGFEDPDESVLADGAAAGDRSSPRLNGFRTKNVHLSGGVMLNLGKSWKAAFEVTQVTTTYSDAAGAETDEKGLQTALSTQFIF